jgi:hypothetical protein
MSLFTLSLIIGAYSYSIFFLGVFSQINNTTIALVTSIFLIAVLYFIKPLNFVKRFEDLILFLKKIGKFEKLLIILICLMTSVNLIGVLGPELSFDALWYHLTIPKIYLLEGRIIHISGGLLYYSDMPKLLEMIYIPGLAYGGETLVKFTHFMFGLLSCIVLYKLSRLFLNTKYSIAAVLIFYSNPVVAWQSTVAYIDLGRTFFEILALFFLLNGSYTRSAVSLGLAITTKLLAFTSLIIFLPLIYFRTKSALESIKFMLLSLLIPLPWFIFSYINTGNPVYPFFTNIYQVSGNFNFFESLKNFVYNADPISPVYILVFPVLILVFRNFSKSEKILAAYSIAAFVLWCFTPQTGGGRFIMAYLPAFSVLAMICLKYLKISLAKNYLWALIICVGIITIMYRAAASYKFVPVILRQTTKTEFLAKNLNYNFGDFYDVEGYFEKNINNSDKVLIYGIHNLYYVNFPFTHNSWHTKGDFFNYVLVQGGVPKGYGNEIPVYENNTTNVKLYKAK